MMAESDERTKAELILNVLEETYRQVIDEVAVPQVGLFYVTDGELRSYREEARETPVDNLGIRYVRFNHEEYWKVVEGVLERTAPGPEMDWRYYPRGRVFYDEEERKFHIVADRCIIKNAAVLNKIVSDFHLPRDRAKIKIKKDPLYRCAKCTTARFHGDRLGDR
jgi:hypothetical protein